MKSIINFILESNQFKAPKWVIDALNSKSCTVFWQNQKVEQLIDKYDALYLVANIPDMLEAFKITDIAATGKYWVLLFADGIKQAGALFDEEGPMTPFEDDDVDFEEAKQYWEENKNNIL